MSFLAQPLPRRCPPVWLLLGFCFFTLVAESAPPAFEPGHSYFGRSNYVEYLAGDLPVIISVPHGGTLAPATLPNRPNGESMSDAFTEELGQTLYQVLHQQLGRYPHLILCRLERAKVDCNREVVEGAGTHPAARQAWQDFHYFVELAKSNVLARTGRGLYLDLHGQSHPIKRIEVGYCLTESQLTNTDQQLNEAAFARASSIRTLATRVPVPFSELLRGSNSFGGLLAAQGYPAVPSPAMRYPGVGELYFDGGYNVRRHGSAQAGNIDGVQLEVYYPDLRNTAANRASFAAALAEVLHTYFAHYYGLNLKKTDPDPP